MSNVSRSSSFAMVENFRLFIESHVKLMIAKESLVALRDVFINTDQVHDLLELVFLDVSLLLVIIEPEFAKHFIDSLFDLWVHWLSSSHVIWVLTRTIECITS